MEGRGHIDLSGGFRAEPFMHDGQLSGFFIVGPAAAACTFDYDGRCGGLVRIRDIGDGKPVWTLNSLDPLDLSPSVNCGCNGQHGFVRGGKWEAA